MEGRNFLTNVNAVLKSHPLHHIKYAITNAGEREIPFTQCINALPPLDRALSMNSQTHTTPD